MAHLPKGQGLIPLPPFKAWLASNIPAVYDNTLSYYEELVALIKYLQDTVVPAINTNAETITILSNAIEQLQQYVDSYFENLDVQEEINNKLDQMAVSGQLTEIISAYLNSNCIVAFNTIADMKAGTNFVDGTFVKTYGKTSLNDEQGQFYKIRTITNSDDVDEIHLIALTNFPSLIAELMYCPFEIKGTSFTNKVYPTQMSFNKSYVGVTKSYEDEQPQASFISSHSVKASNMFSHNPYGLYIETTSLGSGDAADPNIGTQIGLLSNAVNDGKYTSNDEDLIGSVIGLAGFARAETSGSNTVVCGIWSYATTPEVSNEQFSAITEKTSTFGMEINIEMRQPNAEWHKYVTEGSVVGIFINNYTEPNTHDVTQTYDFGIALNGSPIDGNYTHQGFEYFNNFNTGILLDKIVKYGVDFGQYIKDGATCFNIPASWSFESTHPNVTGLNLGDSMLNFGEYLGISNIDGTMWRNDGVLYYRENSTTHEILYTGKEMNCPLILGVESTGNYTNNSIWSYNNNLYYRSNNTNYDVVCANKPIGKPLVLGVETTGSYPNNSIWTYNNILYFKDNTGKTHTISLT